MKHAQYHLAVFLFALVLPFVLPAQESDADLRREAQQAIKNEKWDRAWPIWQEILRTAKTDKVRLECHRQIARCWQELEKPARAAPHYEAAMRLAPDDMDLALDAAAVLVWAERLPAAERTYRRLLKARPRDLEVMRSYMSLLLIMGEFKTVDYIAGKILAQVPDDLGAHEARAEAALARGRTKGAINAYKNILKNDPRSVEAHRGLIEIALRVGDIEEALRWSEALIKVRPREIEHRIDRSILLEEAGDVEGAIVELVAILKSHPNHRDLRARLIQMRAEALRVGAAILDVEKSRELREGNVESFLALGNSGSWRRLLRESASLWEEILADDTSDIDAWSQLARARFDLGDWEAAEKAAQKALLIDPDDDRPALELARIALARAPVVGVRHVESTFKDYDPLTRNNTLKTENQQNSIEAYKALDAKTTLDILWRDSREKEIDLTFDEVDIEIDTTTVGLGMTRFAKDTLVWGFRFERSEDKQSGTTTFPLLDDGVYEGGFAFLSKESGSWTNSLSFSRDRFFLRKIDPLRSRPAHLESWLMLSEYIYSDQHKILMQLGQTDIKEVNDRTDSRIEWQWSPALEDNWVFGVRQHYSAHSTQNLSQLRSKRNDQWLEGGMTTILESNLAYDHHDRTWEYELIPSLSWRLFDSLMLDVQGSFMLGDGEDRDDFRLLETTLSYNF